MNEDFPVQSTTEEASGVWCKGQTVHARAVSSFHLNWADGVLTDGPQADDGVTATRCQQSPVVWELDCDDTVLLTNKVLAVEWRSDIRFIAMNREALGSKFATRIVTSILSTDSYWWSVSIILSCCFCRPLDWSPSNTLPCDRLFCRTLEIKP